MKAGRVYWIFCSICRQVKKYIFSKFEIEYGLDANCEHEWGTEYMGVYKTRKEALKAKKNYRPMRFG